MSMNKACFIGRLTKDPILKTTTNNLPVCSFTIAVDRNYKTDGKYQADFIPCVAWRKTAEVVYKYFRKGSKISVVATMQSRSWTSNAGEKHYSLDAIVDEIGFIERASDIQNDAPMPVASAPEEKFFPAPGDDDDGTLPFDI